MESESHALGWGSFGKGDKDILASLMLVIWEVDMDRWLNKMGALGWL